MSEDKIGTAFAQLFRKGAVMFPGKPPHADDDTCPKCSWPGADPAGWKVYAYISGEAALNASIANGECLFVRCGRCNFGWSESVRIPEGS